jgi:hypothetical protein
VCLLSPRFRQLTERTHTAGETEKEKGEKKKKKKKILLKAEKKEKKKHFWYPVPPKPRTPEKIFIYLFINRETGIRPSFAALDFIFLCALCSHPPTHHPKSHCPFRLNS